MYSPKYFTFKEFIKSDTAEQKDIDNTPDWNEVGNILSLTEHILDPLREAWNKPIKINSGFRCKKLNEAVSGSPTSVHQIGSAADLWPIGYGLKFDEFVAFTINFLQENNIKFDQLLIEKNSRGQVWLHIGEFSNNGSQRGIVKNMYVI